MEAQCSYEALDLSEPSFRVLQINRPSGNHEIQCTIRNATVSSTSYIALSYMWHPENNQPDTADHFIRLNGIRFRVEANLWNFLNLAQQEYPETDIWIDAICINQLDHTERNHQVGLMHRIYSSASSVVAWLGDGDGNTQRFFDFVNEGSWGKSFISRGERLLDPSGFQIAEPEPQGDCILRDGVLKLIRNPYWTRAWIVQELLLAKTIEIMMGPCRMAWSSFFGAMDIQEHAGSAESRAGGQRMAHVRLARDNPDGRTRPTDLYGLVTYFATQECSDLRDKVYSMLGLANERDDFDVDYDSPLEQVVEYTLGRINLENILFALQFVNSLGIPPAEISTRLSTTFLDRMFSSDQTAQYVHVQVVQKDQAETLVQVPAEWKTSTRKNQLILSNCACVTCSSERSHLMPQDDDIVAKLPRSDLMVLCRPQAQKTSFRLFGCLGQDRNSERSGKYLCSMPDKELGELVAEPAETDRPAGSRSLQMLQWRMSWRTVFAISKTAHLGNTPGLVVLVGPRPHDSWKHNYQRSG